jgi:hypothetical protein
MRNPEEGVDGAIIVGAERRRFGADSQSEGCVVDADAG